MNYCGSFSRDKKVCETKEINEISVETNSDMLELTEEFAPKNNYVAIDKSEIEDYYLQTFEKLRIENEPLFQKVISLNKIFLEKVQNFDIEDPQNDIAYLEKIIEILEKQFNLSIIYLHWCLNKAIRIAILEIKNVELVHFFLIKSKFRIRTEYFKEIICEYIRSFGEEDFLDAEEIKVFGYVTILHMLINYGKADINQQEAATHCTPLHLAVFFKQYQFIIILLRLGADMELKNKNGQAPIDIAIENIQNNYDVAIYEEIVGLLTAFKSKDI